MADLQKQWVCIKLYFKRQRSATEAFKMLNVVLGKRQLEQ